MTAEELATTIATEILKKKGLTVTTFYLAKGLEFDQVFALYTTQDNTPLHRQARYICATRALHELYMYEVKASQD